MAVGDRIAAIADFLPRARKPRQWQACGSERSAVGRTPAAIAVKVPEPALVNRSSGGCRDDAHDLRVPAPGQSRKLALLGALDHAAGRLIVERSATKRSTDFVGLLERVDDLYAPRPGRPAKPVVLVLDNGPIHVGKLTRAALEQRSWITVEWLPKYTPEFNDIERSWRDLKRHYLAHQTFQCVDQLDRAVARAVDDLNRERAEHSWHDQRIAA